MDGAAPGGGSPTRPQQAGYDAFISYSHRDNRGVAIAVQRGLERFAKPWYRLRAMRVFRDDASLSANPDLWASIETALSRSSWLIVIGSPRAARSTWMEKEIRWWLDNRDVSTILIVVAAGETEPVDPARPVDGLPAAAVPAVLVDALTAEPRWIDLRGVDVGPKASPDQQERLRRAVADVVAAMRDRPKDELYGEALREHRRTIRLATGTVAALVILTVAALVATVLAVDQRDAARAQATVVTSRQLASTAQSLITTDLTSSLLVAAEAYSLDRSPTTRSALLRAVTSAPTLRRHLPVDRRVSALAASADGSSVSVGTEDGYVIRWDTERFERRERRIATGPITLLGLSADGATVLAGTAERVYLWRAGLGSNPTELDGRSPISAALSPSGHTLAVMWRDGGPDGAVLRAYDGDGRPGSGGRAVDSGGEVALEDDESVVWIGSNGIWERRNARTLQVDQPAAAVQAAPGGGFLPGRSLDGGYYAFAKNDSVSLSRTKSAAGALPEGRGADGFPTGDAAALAVARDGSRVAVANAGTVYVAATYPDEEARAGYAHSQVTPIVGVGPLIERGLAFAGDTLLIGAAPDGVTIWDLALRDGLVRRQALLADGPTAGPEPQISFSADGSRILVEGGGDTFTQGIDGGPVSLPGGYHGEAIPVLAPDGRSLYLAGASSTWPADAGGHNPTVAAAAVRHE